MSTSIASCVSSNAVCRRVSCSLRGLPSVREDFLELAPGHVDVLERVHAAHEVGDLVDLRLIEAEACSGRSWRC